MNTEFIDQAAAIVLSASTPIKTINRLAREARCSRATFWRNWQGAPFSPKDLIDCALYLRIESALNLGLPVSHIAQDLGVDVRTLKRIHQVQRHRVEVRRYLERVAVKHF